MVTRRELRFETVGDAAREAERLLETGYSRAGNWSLGQACLHLATWIRYPLDGFPPLPVWLRPAAWALRNTVAPIYLRRVLVSGKVPRGIPAPLGTVPPATADDREGVSQYVAQLDRLRDYRGTPHPSPLLGPLSAGQLVALTCVHGAHHLSFLVPELVPEHA